VATTLSRVRTAERQQAVRLSCPREQADRHAAEDARWRTGDHAWPEQVVEFAAPIAGKVTKKAFQESFTIDSLQAGPEWNPKSRRPFRAEEPGPPPANIQQFMQMSMKPNDQEFVLCRNRRRSRRCVPPSSASRRRAGK
jgi:hypothetical protein